MNEKMTSELDKQLYVLTILMMFVSMLQFCNSLA